MRSVWAIFVLGLCTALGGCGGSNQFGSGPQNNGNSSVVLAMTDSAPSLVSILSAQVTLTGAQLTPGSVSLFSGSATVDLMRLQTDVAYLSTAANIPAGSYTAVTLTFANPSITFENDTAAPVAGCAVGAICTFVPTAMPMSTTIPLTGFSIAANSTTGLLIDVSLDNLLNASLVENFSAGTSVTPFTPAGNGAPPVGAEDVVGQVGNPNPSNKTFTLTNATGTYSLRVDNTSTFFFSGSGCLTSGFACLQNNQILSVDIGIQPDGSLLARNILFEDADSSDAEVEGTVTGTNAGLQQFDMVIQTMSAAVSGLSIGQHITVQDSALPPTVFDIDLVHADNLQMSTAGFVFTMPADLAIGQQVSIRRNSTSTPSLIKADRVRLRSTRLTATVHTGLPNMLLNNLPSLFTKLGGVTDVTAQTSVSPPTIYFEVGKTINSSDIAIGELVSVRGPMFNVSGGRTLVATKVVVKP